MAKEGKNKGYTYRYNKSGTVTCRAYFDMPNGTREQLPATGKTEKEAREKLKAKYAEICKEGKQIKVKNYTLEEWFNYWLYTIMKPIFDAKESDTTGWYTKLSKKFIPIIGKKKIKLLKISDIQKVVNSMLEKKLSAKYIKEVCCLLSTCLDYAVTEGFMTSLDFTEVKRPKVKKKKKVIYGEDESNTLATYFNSPVFNIKYLPIKVMFDIGIRPEEVGGLNFGDINYSNEFLQIERACIIREIYDSNGKYIGRKKVLKETKTEDGERNIPIPMLIDNLKEQEKHCISKGYSVAENEPIFRNCRGTRYTQETLRDLFHRLAKELNITELGCYSLRHRFCIQHN